MATVGDNLRLSHSPLFRPQRSSLANGAAHKQPGLCAAIIMNRPTSFSRPRFPAVCCHTWFSLQQLQVFQQGHRVLVTKLGGGVIGCQASPKFKITYY